RKSLTVAGDEAQRLDALSAISSWKERLTYLGVPGAAIEELRVSYRSSRSIAAFAHGVLGTLAPPAPPVATPGGARVGRFVCSSEGELALFLTAAPEDLFVREPAASVAVLTRTPEEAAHLARLLEHLPRARLIENGGFLFTPGVDICEVGAAKGLE